MKIALTVTLTALLFTLPVLAGTQIGKVDYIIVRASDGLTYFGLTGGSERNGSPECATSTYWIIKDENSEAGKKQYSMLLAAQASGRSVHVSGMNTCSRWRDGEDVNWMRIRQE